MPSSATPLDASRDVLLALAQFLCAHREQITASWMDAVRKNPRVGAADLLDSCELADHLPAIFDDLADVLQGNAAGQRATRDAEKHGAHRWQQHYRLDEVARELSIVRNLVLAHGLDAFADAHPETVLRELRRARNLILDFFEETLARSVTQYVSKQHEERDRLHEQLREADRARAAADHSERDRLADLFQRAPSFMAVLRGPDHVFTFANARYQLLVGHREILHKPVREALPEVVAQGFPDLLDRVYRTGEPFVANDVRILLQNEPGQPARDFYLDFVYQPTEAADGTIDGVFVHGVDRTEHKRAQEALRKGEEKYRSLFNSIDTGFCVIKMLWDAQGRAVDYRLLELNPAFESHTGLHNAAGHTIREMQPDIEPIWFERYGHVARTGQASRFVEGSDALGRWFDVYAFALGEGPHRRVAVLFSDISEQRRVENELRAAKAEAEAASRAKDEFLAALSHELRTPLTPVLLTAEDLRDDPGLSPEVREKLGMMQRNIALEARLIDDLLDLTRIAKGKLTLRAQECEAHSLAGLAVEIIRDEAQAKGITLAVDFAAMRTSFVGDPARVQQVFWNLLRNAVKFTPEGGQVRLRSHDEGDRLVIEVSDTGAGIAPEFLEKIFRPFEQAGFANSAQFGGLGLGLAIAKAIVELHGGTIRAESAGLGQGATFRVELAADERPIGVAGDPEPENAALPPVQPPSPLPPPGVHRLLLVEDHEATLSVLTRLLTRAGYSVEIASSVAAAREAARHGSFDAVISDIGLPDGTGIELMQALHAEHGLFGIALTGYGMEDDLRRSREAGFVEHLVKPVDFAQLRRALTTLGATLAAAS